MFVDDHPLFFDEDHVTRYANDVVYQPFLEHLKKQTPRF